MHQVNLQEAEAQLAKLIEEAAGGEDVIITRNDGQSFKIVPIDPVKAIPKFGSARGLVKMADDFDEPLEGFEDDPLLFFKAQHQRVDYRENGKLRNPDRASRFASD